jgi:hypothetical protein
MIRSGNKVKTAAALVLLLAFLPYGAQRATAGLYGRSSKDRERGKCVSQNLQEQTEEPLQREAERRVEARPIPPVFNFPTALIPEKGAFILDSNVLYALVRAIDYYPRPLDTPAREMALKELEYRTHMTREQLLDRETRHSYMWLTPRVIKEYGQGARVQTPPLGIHRSMLSVARDSPKYQAAIDILAKLGVGGAEGRHDREIIAEALFAKAEDHAIPTFMTMDKKLFEPLCSLSPECRELLRLRLGSPEKKLHDGFVIEVPVSESETRKLRILPVLRR